MTKEDSQEKPTLKSLIAQAKGIEPLIIGIFIIAIYWFMSAIAYFLSWKFGRL
jgi:hypothetical protein